MDLKLKILITGGTGFVGRSLINRLVESNHEVVVLSRNSTGASKVISAPAKIFEWQPEVATPPLAAYSGIDAIVHLAGESIVAGRWTKKQKEKISESRVLGTRHLLKGVIAASADPKVIVVASAIGIYGDRGDEPLSETSPTGSGFLAQVCTAWEAASRYPGLETIRTVNLRIGIVLGQDGGILQRLIPLYKLGLGGTIGSGTQWLSWIHRLDLIEMILYSLSHTSLSGAINAVAPYPTTNSQFSKTLAEKLNRPAFISLPAWILKIAMGEASQLALGSQKVTAKTITDSGFTFRFPTIQLALEEICK